MLSCPVCQSPLTQGEKEAFCEKGHRFDRAKEGYFNLLMSSSAKGHGDDRAMLRARRTFLEKGYYAHLLSALKEEILPLLKDGDVLVDAGCGEGYYTKGLVDQGKKEGKELSLYAFDISKEAVRLTSRKLEGEGNFFVASTYKIPMAEGSADVVCSFFAPYSEEEFLRLIRPGGYLVRAVPLRDHLFSLKQAVYENPKKNEGEAVIGEGFTLIGERRVRKEITLETTEDILALFDMTPYAHKTGREDMAKLEKLTSLTVETDFGILLYQREKKSLK